MGKIKYYIQHPHEIIIALGEHGMLPMISDEKFIQYKYRVRV